MQNGRSVIIFGCLGDKDDDINKLKDYILVTFEKFGIWEDKQGDTPTSLDEGARATPRFSRLAMFCMTSWAQHLGDDSGSDEYTCRSCVVVFCNASRR